MSIHDSSFVDEHGAAANETAAAVLAGYEMAGPQKVGTGERFYALPVSENANLELIDTAALEAEFEAKYAAHPRRKKGTVHVQDAESFIAYIAKHGLPCSEVYADLSRMKLVGVINDHDTAGDDEGAAGHRDHRVSLELIPTDAWKAWLAHDKEKLTQVAFAEHIEDRAIDVIDPDAATMLEIAQTLLATPNVDFKSANRLSDGQVQFRYEETIAARAGEHGEFEVPSEFLIQVSPFEGCPPVEIVARFRYRISPSGLALFYALRNPAEVAREAFTAYVDTVAESITQPLFRGRPE